MKQQVSREEAIRRLLAKGYKLDYILGYPATESEKAVFLEPDNTVMTRDLAIQRLRNKGYTDEQIFGTKQQVEQKTNVTDPIDYGKYLGMTARAGLGGVASVGDIPSLAYNLAMQGSPAIKAMVNADYKKQMREGTAQPPKQAPYPSELTKKAFDTITSEKYIPSTEGQKIYSDVVETGASTLLPFAEGGRLARYALQPAESLGSSILKKTAKPAAKYLGFQGVKSGQELAGLLGSSAGTSYLSQEGYSPVESAIYGTLLGAPVSSAATFLPNYKGNFAARGTNKIFGVDPEKVSVMEKANLTPNIGDTGNAFSQSLYYRGLPQTMTGGGKVAETSLSNLRKLESGIGDLSSFEAPEYATGSYKGQEYSKKIADKQYPSGITTRTEAGNILQPRTEHALLQEKQAEKEAYKKAENGVNMNAEVPLHDSILRGYYKLIGNNPIDATLETVLPGSAKNELNKILGKRVTSLQDARDIQSSLRGILRDRTLTPYQKNSVNKFLNPVKEVIKDSFYEQNPKAYEDYLSAEKLFAINKPFWKETGKDRGLGDKILQANPEQVYDIAMSGSVKGATDLNLLRNRVKEMPELASLYINDLGLDSQGNFSINKFLTSYNDKKIPKETKSALLSEDQIQGLDNFAKAADLVRMGEKFKNTSNTAGAINSGNFLSLATRPLSLITNPTVAVLMTSPKFTKWLARSAYIKNPTNYKTHIKTLAKTLGRDPQYRPYYEEYMNAFNQDQGGESYSQKNQRQEEENAIQ